MTEPHRTRRERGEPVDATRREQPAGGPAATRRESGAGSASTDIHSLLAPELFPVHLRPTTRDASLWKTSGEAQLFLVPNGDDEHRVLKIYFPHIAPDPTVSAQLPTLRSKHVVEVTETGTLTDGRAFELMEHLPAGTLRENGAGSQVFDTARITEIVRQLTSGLRVLHEHGIIHRDLKPENVLVRDTGQRLELVLSDFGLSRKLTGTAHFTTVGQTPTYAAPESWAGHVSSALDWWAVGMMALELATGQQPFAGLDILMVQMAVTTKPIPVDAVTDPRLHRLCAGLLVSDESQRWSHVQVLDWLGGGSPQIPDRRVPVEATEFEFGNQRHRDIASLTEAMSRDWRLAARRFGMTHGSTWRALTLWLDQFNDPGRNEPGVVEQRLDLLDRLERSKDKPDVVLVRLLAGLNPRLPPVYRGATVDRARLREWARQAQGDGQSQETTRAREILHDLHGASLLTVLARFAGGADLAAVADDWRARRGELNAATRDLDRYPRLRSLFTAENRPAARAAMLELAAGGQCGEDWLRQFTDQSDAPAQQLGWFDEVRRWVGDDHVRAYAGLYAIGIATAEADAALRAAQAAEQARLAHARAWDVHEAGRLAGRPGATGRAVAGAAALTGLWLLVVAFAPKQDALWLVALAVVTHWAVELSLATVLGGDYHPRYSLWQGIQVAAGQLGRRMRSSPRGWLIGLVVGLILLGSFAGTAPVVALVAGVVHVVTGAHRHSRWKTAHEQDRRRVTGQ